MRCGRLSHKPQDEEEFALQSPGDTEAVTVGSDSAPRSVVPLVIVPLLLVSAFVAVTVLFGWLALDGDRPEELVTELQRADRGSFRAAVALVQMLRDPANKELRRNQMLAGQLAEILEIELEAGSRDPERIQLRSFLCRALGEFEDVQSLRVLILAVETERDPQEIEVRRSALEAIAQLVARRPARDAPLDPRVSQAARDATQPPPTEEVDARPRDALRATAAFTLGVIGDDAARTRLVQLLEDSSPDVRFNAATGLARHGRAEAEVVLLEMLDPDAPAIVDAETTARGKAWRRQIVLRNGLRSVELLRAANRQLDTSRLTERVRRLTAYADDPIVQHEARMTLQALEALPP